jgi:hypothetical protein
MISFNDAKSSKLKLTDTDCFPVLFYEAVMGFRLIVLLLMIKILE